MSRELVRETLLALACAAMLGAILVGVAVMTL